MTISRKDARHRTQAPERPYGSVSNLLETALIGMYAMSEEQAALLVKESYRSRLLASDPAEPAEKWVIGAAMKCAETYERMHRPPGAQDLAAQIAQNRKLALTREALETLPENARKAIRLRIDEKKSYVEIAAELGVTAHYAEHLVLVGVAKLVTLRRRQRTQEE